MFSTITDEPSARFLIFIPPNCAAVSMPMSTVSGKRSARPTLSAADLLWYSVLRV